MRTHRQALLVTALVAFATSAVYAQSVRISVTPSRPGVGGLVRLSLHDAPDTTKVTALSGTMAGEPLHFVRDGRGVPWAIGAVPLDASDSVLVFVYLQRAGGRTDTVRATVRAPHRPEERPGVASRRARRLRVDPRFAQRVDSATEARIAAENGRAREIGRAAHDTPRLWSEPFLRPRRSRVTSTFASGRVFNGRVASSHGGVDFAGHVGEPVRAANRGLVALVDTFFLAGRVIYIDHGGGIVTGYFHLSKAEVAPGDTVQRGQEIGLVGATGRVTGPHLHWSARYGTLTVDPLDLITVSMDPNRRTRTTRSAGGASH